MNLHQQAASISQKKKIRFLRNMSENEFRDRVIRPLFLNKGFKYGKDYCGPNEAGKDVVFTSENRLGYLDIYVVQTKKGNLNLAKRYSTSVIEATTQLKTALKTPIRLIEEKEKKYPNRAVLAVSGKINDSARSYICDELHEPNIIFLDIDSLVPDIDEYIPELWCDIDADLLPYIRSIKHRIKTYTQLFTKSELISADLPSVAVSNQFFVTLKVFRNILRSKKVGGKIQKYPDIEEFPATDLIKRKESLFLLVGSAGSGKSTSLLRMVYILCEKAESTDTNIIIPIFLRADDIYRESELPLLDLAISNTIDISNINTSPIKKKDLDDGRLFIFIDGLDEIAHLENQKEIVKRIISFHNKYPKCKILISSRDYSFLEKIPSLSLFLQFNLSSISYKQAEKIIKRLRKQQSLPVEKSSEFLRRIQDVHGLELNPLIVTVFAASSEYSRRDIPANITELFKKFTEMMLGRWDAGKGLSLQYQAPLKDFILTQIAFQMHTNKEIRISKRKFMNLISHELEIRGHHAETETLTDEIINRSGLFRVIGNEIEFRHLMLQEFFAGRGLPQKKINDTLYALIIDDWWRNPLVFYFGNSPNESVLLKDLTQKLHMVSDPALYQSAITVGLALQASYLLEISDRIPLTQWVIKSLADVYNDFDKQVVSSSRFPLLKFLNYYLFARDSVAFSLLKHHHKEIRKLLVGNTENKHLKELRHFWLIIGLIETGDLHSAEEEIKTFNPSDRRLFLGIYMGCSLIQHVRVTTNSERNQAKRICEFVSKYLPDLKKQIIEEFKTELLEVQNDKIKAISGTEEPRRLSS